MTQIVRRSGPEFYTGQGTVGTIEATISPTLPIARQIVLKASPSNLSWIAVGQPKGAINGFVLQAGEQSPPIYIDSTAGLAVIGGAGGQKFSWIAS